MSHSIKITIPIILLVSALLFVNFGSNLLNDGYGLSRDKVITSPTITSTKSDINSIESLHGYTTYLTFGFSHCTDSCPFTLAQFVKLAALLPDDIQLIFVSVDNKRDDIPQLKNYLAQIDPNIVGWKVADNELAAFAEQFDTLLNLKDELQPGHGSAIQLLDRNGRWVKTYPYLNLNENAVMQDYIHLQHNT